MTKVKALLELLEDFTQSYGALATTDDIAGVAGVEDEDIKKRGNKWVLYSKKTGKRLGTHPSKAKALRQERAIEIAKHGG